MFHTRKVCLAWMSSMVCYVVLKLCLVLMDGRVRLEWMSAMMCCCFDIVLGGCEGLP